MRLLALQERQLVHAVDGSILRDDVCSDRSRERRKEIDLVHDLVRDLPSRDVSWPADHCSHPHATLQDGVVEAGPGA